MSRRSGGSVCVGADDDDDDACADEDEDADADEEEEGDDAWPLLGELAAPNSVDRGVGDCNAGGGGPALSMPSRAATSAASLAAAEDAADLPAFFLDLLDELISGARRSDGQRVAHERVWWF